MKQDPAAKKLLISTFKTLAREKPLSKITVSDIAAASSLSRQTFYLYFIDKYDIACSMYHSEIHDIINTYNQEKDFVHLTASVMHLMKEDSILYKNLLNDIEGQNSFFSYWLNFNESYMKQYVGKLSFELEIAITMYCYGSMMGIYHWIFKDVKESEEIIAKIIVENMPAILKTYYL